MNSIDPLLIRSRHALHSYDTSRRRPSTLKSPRSTQTGAFGHIDGTGPNAEHAQERSDRARELAAVLVRTQGSATITLAGLSRQPGRAVAASQLAVSQLLPTLSGGSSMTAWFLRDRGASCHLRAAPEWT